MFIAYKEDCKEQYVSQSGLNPENLPALKVKTADGDKFAFLKTSGNNLSKIKVNISNKSYYLQKMNPICIAISTSSTYKIFTYLNGALQEVNAIFANAPEKYQRLRFVQYIPEYGVYMAFLNTKGDISYSGWHWFFQIPIGDIKTATFVGISFDGVNFTFSSSALSDNEPPLYVFYNKKEKLIEVGCYYSSGARPVVNTDTCKALEFDIESYTLIDYKTKSSGISMGKATILRTNKGNIFYANHEGDYIGYDFGFYENWKCDKKKDFNVYYNQTLAKIYLEANGEFYKIDDTESSTENDIKSCEESEFYKSYGNINGYEIYSATQIYKDFNNKIDLETPLYSLGPVSMSYDFYTKKYILLCADDNNIYIKATLDFKNYEILYSTLKKDITYGTISGFSNSYRVEIS